MKLGWDDEIPQVNQSEWQNWLGTLPHLHNISVIRCFKPQGFGDIKNAQLHLFSDGSELSYGASAYLRLVDVYDNITCSLVIGKSRLAPFLDLNLYISNGTVSTKIYDKQDDFDFDIVNFTFLDGNVPRRTLYGVYIFQLIRIARASSNLNDFN